MSDFPPPNVEYPRTASGYGSAAHLKSLMEGYYGYGPLFAIHVVLSLGVAGASIVMGKNGTLFYWAGIFLVMLLMGFLSYRVNAKVGLGASWSKTQIILASVAIALGTVCYGIVGYIVLQTIASNHIKRYGVRSGCMGLRKKAIQARIAELQAAEAAPSGAYPRL